MEQVGLAAASTDVSLWSLFMQAGFVVKLVMIGLIAASVWTWAIVVDKTLAFGKARRQLQCVAAKGNGTYYGVDSADQLRTA